MRDRPKGEKQWVPLEHLAFLREFQMRDELFDEATVRRYEECLADGDEFPPLEVVKDPESVVYWVIDGFQRGEAYNRRSLGQAECVVYPGTRKDALLWACGSNAKHGQPRSPAECRRAFDTVATNPDLLRRTLDAAKDAGGVHRALAVACGISKGAVYKYLEATGLEATRAGKLVPAKPKPEKQKLPPDHTPTPGVPGTADATPARAEADPSANGTPRATDPDDDARTFDSANGDEVAAQSVTSALKALDKAWFQVLNHLLPGEYGTHLRRHAKKHGVPIEKGTGEGGQPIGSPLPKVETAYYWAGWVQLRAALADTGESIARAAEKAKGGG